METVENHQIVVRRRGAPGVLSWIRTKVEDPAEGEVLVRVEAAGVSGYDLMLRRYWFFGFPKPPYTPGEDLVGIVEKVGQGVTNLEVGQRVAGWTFGKGGGYAEMAVRPANTLVPVPDQLDPVTAAAVVTNYLTAALTLQETAKMRSGEQVLIHGAGGGVGSALVQLGKLAGLKLYGTGSDKSADFITDHGAVAINYRTESFVRRIRELTDDGVDVVIDVIGGARQLWRSSRCLKRGGRLLMLGVASTKKSGVSAIPLSLIGIGLVALWPNGIRTPMSPSMLSYPEKNMDWYAETLTDLLMKAAEGQLQPAIAAEIPMCNAAKAHELLEQGGQVGKIVLTTTG